MGTGKKEKNRLLREGKASDGVKVKGENFYRSAKKVKLLNMYKDGGATRNKDGKIIRAASLQSRDVPKAVIQPDRRWFNSTRVIAQSTLESFRNAMDEQQKDPYKVLLRTNKIPLSLIRDNKDALPEDGIRKHRARITVETEPFAQVFGPKAQRKRVKLSVPDIGALAGDSSTHFDRFEERQEEMKLLSGQLGNEDDELGDTAPEPIFLKGTSLDQQLHYGVVVFEMDKVIDSSDVVLMILDARDPLGTRCRSVEKFLRNEAPHKHLVFVLNKVDLVPTKVAASWVRVLQKEYPTCALRSSIKNPFGRGSLIDLLRQFSILHKDKKQISVGLIGYPNVGKSSVINCLRGKQVATVAPIPGETKVWQYVALMKRIHMIDCPGIVPPNRQDTPSDLLLRGSVRVENVDNPAQYIPAVLNRVKPHHMERTYDVRGWSDYQDFLAMLARKGGRLLRGGDPDSDGVAKMVLNDFMRGKIPWFVAPPAGAGAGNHDEAVTEGREGRLGEMPKKRKREVESVADTSVTMASTTAGEQASEEEDEFEGFGSPSAPSLDSASPAADQDAVASGDMIPLDVSSDEEDDGEEDEDGQEEDGEDSSDEESDDGIDIDMQALKEELLNESDQESEAKPAVRKKQRRAR